MNCCINDLGLKAHNENIDLGVQADQAGQFIAVLFFAGMRINRAFTLAIGDDLIIPRPFNEMYQYKMQIKKPDGELLSINDCDTFAFQTYINITPPCAPCADCDEEGAYS
jgi:hypothetical protein